MEGKTVMGSDWFRRLAERVGLGDRDEPPPDWTLDELRPSFEREGDLAEATCIADIPAALRRRLQEEAVQKTFYRLEPQLRFLLYATVPGQEPQSLQECHDILNLWRQGLEKEARLVPDAYAGAVVPYDPSLDRAYHVNGRCEPGDPVRITVPAWRIEGAVIVRGEAEPMEPLVPPVLPDAPDAPADDNWSAAKTDCWGAPPEEPCASATAESWDAPGID